jgi:hypothetical protein
MSMDAARIVVAVAQGYVAAGVVFAAAFAWRGAARLDPLAREATVGFRLLIGPGAAIVWPVLAARLLRGRTQPPEEWTAHRAAARRHAAAAAMGGHR